MGGKGVFNVPAWVGIVGSAYLVLFVLAFFVPIPALQYVHGCGLGSATPEGAVTEYVQAELGHSHWPACINTDPHSGWRHDAPKVKKFRDQIFRVDQGDGYLIGASATPDSGAPIYNETTGELVAVLSTRSNLVGRYVVNWNGSFFPTPSEAKERALPFS